MIVIADTSPLHYLVLLEYAEVLQHLYGRVIIPRAVVRELQAERTPPGVRQWIANPPSWLEVREITVPPDPALADPKPGPCQLHATSDAQLPGAHSSRRESRRLRGALPPVRWLHVRLGQVLLARCGAGLLWSWFVFVIALRLSDARGCYQ